MKPLLALALLAPLAGSLAAPAADLVVTKQKHTDAAKVMNQDQPAKDSTEVTWIGKDRMRVEEGDKVTLVRLDLKKMYLLDTKAKTYSALDLPFDMQKFVPAEMAPMMEHMFSQMKVTVTPGTETKKVKDWNTTRCTVTTTMPMGGASTQEMWVTKDVTLDMAAWHEMSAALLAATPFGAGMAAEMKKVDGLPVLVEHTQKIMGSEVKSRESVQSIEQKEPAAGLYDLPEGYTEKPFDPMAEMMGGGPGGPGGRGPRRQ